MTKYLWSPEGLMYGSMDYRRCKYYRLCAADALAHSRWLVRQNLVTIKEIAPHDWNWYYNTPSYATIWNGNPINRYDHKR